VNTQPYTEALERALGIIVARSQADMQLVRERAEAITAAAGAKVAEADARIALMERSLADRLATLKDGIDGACGPEGPAGQDGKSFAVRGTWSETETYHELDVVALGGASFAAKCDDPGPCPGEGWQLVAAQGKRGNPGERGTVRGAPTALAVDEEGLLTLTNADGSRLSCDLYPLLSKLVR
jgi:hypothetical protein